MSRREKQDRGKYRHQRKKRLERLREDEDEMENFGRRNFFEKEADASAENGKTGYRTVM